MNRLTSKKPLTEFETMNLFLTDLYNRLKEYEDTELEPNEIKTAHEIVARLALADYPHNFQHERSDIIAYMRFITSLMRDAKSYWKRILTERKCD